jgi:drug/metabolite transporter (DMT)-like permease
MRMKTYIVLITATMAVAAGEALLSAGMKQVGDVSQGEVLCKVAKMLTNRRVLGGILLMALFFFLYSAVLSWADLSYVMPMTSLSFLFGTILAKWFLHEQVSGWRWGGALVIILGIILIAQDYHQLTVPTNK